MAASANLTALVSNLGNYYQEHRDEIFSDVLLGLEPAFQAQGIAIEDGVADEVPLLNLSMGNILQPGDFSSTNFTNDVLTLSNRKLKVQPVKADLKFFPQDFERKWITHNRTKRATMKDWEDIPFYAYFMMKIQEKMKEELYYATWTARMANATTTYTSIVDGIITLLKADIALGNVSQVGSGNAITSGNVVTELELIGDGVSAANAATPTYMYVSPTVAKWYIRADASAIGRGGAEFNGIAHAMNPMGFPEFTLRGTNIRIVAVPALAQSLTGLNNEAVIVSQGENIVVGTDSMNEINEMDFQKVDRYIKILVDFKWGVNYRLANTARKPIFVNAGPNW